MSLILLRHCQSDDNAAGVFVGRNDSPLSSEGRKVASALHIDAEICYTSPLLRAKDTAKAVFANDIPIFVINELIERDWGKLSGCTYGDACDQFGTSVVQRACKSEHIRAPGGESDMEVFARIVPFLLRKVIPDVVSGHNVCIVSHTRCIQAICRAIGKKNSRIECGKFVTYNRNTLFDPIISLSMTNFYDHDNHDLNEQS